LGLGKFPHREFFNPLKVGNFSPQPFPKAHKFSGKFPKDLRKFPANLERKEKRVFKKRKICGLSQTFQHKFFLPFPSLFGPPFPPQFVKANPVGCSPLGAPLKRGPHNEKDGTLWDRFAFPFQTPFSLPPSPLLTGKGPQSFLWEP